MTDREKRFWSRVEKMSDGCWMWTGPKNQKGYAAMMPTPPGLMP